MGLDTTYQIAEIMFSEYKEQKYAPPPLLKRMVLAGMYDDRIASRLAAGTVVKVEGPDRRLER